MRADVIEGKHPFTGVADYDLPAAELIGAHAPRCQLLEGPHGLEAQLVHDLQLDLGLEDRHRLADDPDTLDGTVADFQLDIDSARAVELVALHSAERHPRLIAR